MSMWMLHKGREIKISETCKYKFSNRQCT